MSIDNIIAGLPAFIADHTELGTSHAPTLADAILKYFHGSPRLRKNILTWLEQHEYVDRSHKVAYVRLSTKGGLPLHPVSGKPVVR